MATLFQHLRQLPTHDLRAIATRLAVSSRAQRHKDEWLSSIVAAWSAPHQADALLAQLSAQARSALARLVQLEQIPGPLFRAEYGAVRRARQATYATPPWQAPATVSEELYYVGLLHAREAKPVDKAAALCTPADLRPYLLSRLVQPPLTPVAVVPTDISWSVASAFCHDVAHLLVYLEEYTAHFGKSLSLAHGRWLPRAHLAAWHQRMAGAEQRPAPTSHRSTPRLRLCMALATLAGLVDRGTVLPLGEAWLAEPVDAQVAVLWRAWLQASPQARAAFALADGKLPMPWPTTLVSALAGQREPVSPHMLSQRLLALDTDPQYWVSQVKDLSDLEHLLAAVLQEILTPLAVVEPVAIHNRGAPLYRLTQVGHWLTAGDSPAPVVDSASGNARLADDADATGWQLRIHAARSAALHLRTVRFAAHQRVEQAADGLWHVYRMDGVTVTRAQCMGIGIPSILALFRDLNLELSEVQLQTLRTWESQANKMTLAYLPVLRTRTSDDLAALAQSPTLRDLLGDVLGPAAASLNVTVQEAAQMLAAAGLPSRVLATGTSAPTLGSAPTTGSAPTPVSAPTTGSASSAAPALWLAGQVYLALSAYLPLPLMLPPADLDKLLHRLAPEQQAMLARQLQQVQEDLRNLLDGRVFAPPPQAAPESDRRTAIAQGLDERQDLDMVYFSPGRNLETRRRVTPYWVEEFRGHGYLRAYCHLSGQVLTFRLDRIVALSAYDPTTR